MYKIKLKIVGIILVILFLAGCTKVNEQQVQQPVQEAQLEQENIPTQEVQPDQLGAPQWANNATMYEVNIRQYTTEGTFKAFEEHLPRLQQMGVKILWLMPTYPISVEKRIDSLGSYYAIADYKGINPEFGNEEDFKHLVDKCHEMGFKVLMDWVGNHTGWDNAWIVEHPDWYTQNAKGEILYPETWQDVADLNYDQVGMQEAMLEAMTYWVEVFDIDGYRCDYAGGVPVDFWNTARTALEKIKPVYMLAEEGSNMSLLKYAFHANYGWNFYNALRDIAKGNKNASSLESYFRLNKSHYPDGTYPLNFIDNHDENSWNGTVEERFGDAQQAMLTLIFTTPGMPLIYSGQEVNLNKSLLFFDKDYIDWEVFENEALLTKLINLKSEHPALYNGAAGGEIIVLETSDQDVFAFTRQKDEDQVIVILNLSDQLKSVKFKFEGTYEGVDLTTAERYNLEDGENDISLSPWEFLIITQ